MERPTLVLPTPGAPTKHSMGPGGMREREREREYKQIKHFYLITTYAYL